jgi:hypothetical protein
VGDLTDRVSEYVPPASDASFLIARADLLALDAQKLRELADRADELSVWMRELGFHLLVKEGKND